MCMWLNSCSGWCKSTPIGMWDKARFSMTFSVLHSTSVQKRSRHQSRSGPLSAIVPFQITYLTTLNFSRCARMPLLLFGIHQIPFEFLDAIPLRSIPEKVRSLDHTHIATYPRNRQSPPSRIIQETIFIFQSILYVCLGRCYLVDLSVSKVDRSLLSSHRRRTDR
jgi:hypothetical protein